MPCLLAAIAFFFPRLVILLLVVFGDYIGRAYDTFLWPLLGFFFLPYTTLAYAWAINSSPDQALRGWGLAVFVVAILLDLGVIGGGANANRK
jgi:hypothetical protein